MKGRVGWCEQVWTVMFLYGHLGVRRNAGVDGATTPDASDILFVSSLFLSDLWRPPPTGKSLFALPQLLYKHVFVDE